MPEDYNINFDGELEEDVESFNMDETSNDSETEAKTQAPKKALSGKLVAKDMLIADIVEEHPELVPMIMDYGVHCVGCGASMFETLEEGFMGHGMVDEEIDEIITDLNTYIQNNAADAKKA